MSERQNKRRREQRAIHGEEVRAKDRARYERDRERIKARQLSYYHKSTKEENKQKYAAQRELFCARQKMYYAKWITQIHAFLGNSCACCGEREREFFCIDHIQNDGRHVKRSKAGSRIRVYTTEIRRAFLSENVTRIAEIKKRFQILCHNCNQSKHYGDGVCAHRRGDVTKHPEFPYASATGGHG